jgi:pimeloyl-ACP methyl ester carboxylesterase
MTSKTATSNRPVGNDAAGNNKAGNDHSRKTFVLVHGAWHGGWCWSRVAEPLRAMGHRVYTPTQTGLGERQHLLGDTITLNTFVQDIANVLLWEDLHDVILVGHSFGGLTITGVADILPKRLAHLAYLDAFILESGITTFDTLPLAMVNKLRTAAETAALASLHDRRRHGKALQTSTIQLRHAPAVPAPKPSVFGLTKRGDTAFVSKRLTPQPLSVYESALNLTYPVGNNVPCTYLHCTNPDFSAVRTSYQWVRSHTDWPCVDLPSCHSAMVADPQLVIDALLAL